MNTPWFIPLLYKPSMYLVDIPCFKTYRFYNNEIKKNDYLVIPFSKMESKYLSNYESVYNEFSQVLKKYNENIKIEPLPSAN